MITVQPKSETYDLLLTAQTAISHHDPAESGESNANLFNRQKQLLPVPFSGLLPEPEDIRAFCEAHPAPPDLALALGDCSFAECVACVFVYRFLQIYNPRNGGNGEGLFEGETRYSRLEDRLRHAAVRSQDLRATWDRLARDLRVSVHESRYDAPLLALLSLPKGLQSLATRALMEHYRSVVMLARLWYAEERERRKSETGFEDWKILDFDAVDSAGRSTDRAVFEVPAVSGNALRHQVAREPAWLHLRRSLGLDRAYPGQGPVPPSVEAIFYNGGNIDAGQKAPTNPFALAWRMRETYPSLDLLGGVADGFDLGESRLKVAGWIVCRENREALRGAAAYDHPNAAVSVYDLLDDVTLTRQSGEVGEGQMIYNFETLAAGTAVLCRLSLAPYTPELTRGALFAAAETYLESVARLGGQSRAGFGVVSGEWLDAPDLAPKAAYEAYLMENREALRAGLETGTMGCDRAVLT